MKTPHTPRYLPHGRIQTSLPPPHGPLFPQTGGERQPRSWCRRAPRLLMVSELCLGDVQCLWESAGHTERAHATDGAVG